MSYKIILILAIIGSCFIDFRKETLTNMFLATQCLSPAQKRKPMYIEPALRICSTTNSRYASIL
uniref:Heat shock protein binding protein n=1 Tax=Solanum tuberosum TaxID=4113 RepID=M0ZL15_SOLTU